MKIWESFCDVLHQKDLKDAQKTAVVHQMTRSIVPSLVRVLRHTKTWPLAERGHVGFRNY